MPRCRSWQGSLFSTGSSTTGGRAGCPGRHGLVPPVRGSGRADRRRMRQCGQGAVACAGTSSSWRASRAASTRAADHVLDAVGRPQPAHHLAHGVAGSSASRSPRPSRAAQQLPLVVVGQAPRLCQQRRRPVAAHVVGVGLAGAFRLPEQAEQVVPELERLAQRQAVRGVRPRAAARPRRPEHRRSAGAARRCTWRSCTGSPSATPRCPDRLRYAGSPGTRPRSARGPAPTTTGGPGRDTRRADRWWRTAARPVPSAGPRPASRATSPRLRRPGDAATAPRRATCAVGRPCRSGLSSMRSSCTTAAACTSSMEAAARTSASLSGCPTARQPQ